MANRVIPPHKRDANDTHDSLYWRRDEVDALEGPEGPIGPRGPAGAGVDVLGLVDEEGDLPAEGNAVGDAYLVNNPLEDYFGDGSYGVGPYGTGRPVLFVWVGDEDGWVPSGPIEGPQGDPGEPGEPGADAEIPDLSGYALVDHDHDGDYAEPTHSHVPTEIVGVMSEAQVPSLPASKITSGTLSVDRIPDLDARKVTSGAFLSPRIPSLDTGKITTGTFLDERIPNLNASKITAGTFSADRIPSLDASKIASGTFSTSRIPALTLTHLFPNNRKCVGSSRLFRIGPENVHSAIATISVGTQFHYFGWTRTTDEEWAYVMIPGLGFGWFPTAQMGAI